MSTDDDRNELGQFTEGNDARPHAPCTKHGVYTYERNRKLPASRQTPRNLARVDEIRANVQTLAGLTEEQERLTETALVAVDLAISWVNERRRAGVALQNIKIFGSIPALINSAGRQIKQLEAMHAKALAGDSAILDAAMRAADGENGEETDESGETRA